MHFLGGGAQWNTKVDSFDVTVFADQMEQAQAGYVMFTLGQNSGYYCSPNATYDKLCGYKAGTHCSKRDLPAELAQALARHHIPLMLYLPSRSPQNDVNAMERLGDIHEYKPAPQEFTAKWSEIIREWSLRYDDMVWGWWFDGSYNRAGWDDLSKPNNWNTWAAACRAGNPQCILAFNPGAGPEKAFTKLTGQQDYTAGEMNTYNATPESHPAVENLQWHVLGYLGSSWGKADGPRYDDAAIIEYVKTVNAQGGVVSMDVHVDDNGRVHTPHLEQLKAIAEVIRKP